MVSDPAARAGAVLEIDLAGIVANWRRLRRMVAPAGCAAVLKANAYGLGASPVGGALAAAGCRLFFVATLDEAAELRAALPAAADIAVLNGPLPGSAGDFAALGLIPVLNAPGQVADWQRIAAAAGGLAAMLHIDTGMARLGLSPREVAGLAEALAPGGAIRWRALLSHLACADTPSHPLNELQRARFAAARDALAGVPASLAASSGIFLGSGFHFDLVRPGAALYGVNAQPGTVNRLRQVVRLSGKIVQVREVDRGDPVGYGAAHVMDGPGRLATVAVGYADGWLRSFSHRGCGRLAGQRVPLLGRVSMDLVTFDVTAVPAALARPGDFVELIGDDYGVDDAAADAGTNGYEILTALGARYHRRYRNAPAG